MTMAQGDDPAVMQARIVALEGEVAQLQRRLGDERVGEGLRTAFTQAGAAGTITAPTAHGDLLDQIVATAAYVLHAQAASLFLVDEDTEELVFEVALGEKAAEVKKFRLPLGQGIAGFTASTGQALAVADVQQDPRWAQEIGKAVHYLPQSILSVPLSVEDRVIGVLELLDKEGGKPFGADDIQTAGLFASQAAIAIEQSRVAQSLTRLLRVSLAELGTERSDLVTQAMEAAVQTEESMAYRETLQIAATLAEISRRGDAARRLCEQIVEGIYTYLRSQPRL